MWERRERRGRKEGRREAREKGEDEGRENRICYLSRIPGEASTCWTFLNPTNRYGRFGQLLAQDISSINLASHSYYITL